MKEDTVWNFERLQSYIDEKYAKEKELPENWVYTTFTVSFLPTYSSSCFLFRMEGRNLVLLQRAKICFQSINVEIQSIL